MIAEENYLTLKQQLDRLQREVNDLSKSVYSGSRDYQLSQEAIQDEESKFTAFDLRIYDLEKDIKNLNKNFEELIFQIDDIKNLYEELVENMDSKLLNIQNNLSNIKITLANKTANINRSIKKNNIAKLLELKSMTVISKISFYVWFFYSYY